ncbi:MAG: DNA-directed RNA polymerase subunit alpha [Armatimonadetes bacterium]|jgi:DNA-directed RNA polymerase subunit alpha|nr:DNA-directed RNA polymerase subunit alpha [Armatimonadota bacterium]
MDMVTPRIEILEDGENYGKFAIEPLEQGFGYTIGNALRRVLLSAVPGAAITSIKIDGVLHQFSTIPGVKEDTTELMLNLRDLYVEMDATSQDTEPLTVRIDVHGPGDVTGADIQTPPEIRIVNPEMHIATLNDEVAHLSAEMTVEQGKGYVLPENQENINASIGVIPVGAVFSPVRKVAYTVDPCRVGHKTNFDRLVIDVTTNGTIAPSDALSLAAKILDKQLKLFFDFARTHKGLGADYGDSAVGLSPGPPEARIEELDFSVRTYNCLKKANVLSISELVQLSEADLMNIRNFGKKSLDEVKSKLASLNLDLKPVGDRSELKILPADETESPMGFAYAETEAEAKEIDEAEETEE